MRKSELAAVLPRAAVAPAAENAEAGHAEQAGGYRFGHRDDLQADAVSVGHDPVAELSREAVQ